MLPIQTPFTNASEERHGEVVKTGAVLVGVRLVLVGIKGLILDETALDIKVVDIKVIAVVEESFVEEAVKYLIKLMIGL